jgi:hypothetical protein
MHEESMVSGPCRLLPQPVVDALLHLRNVEAMRRRSFLVEPRERRRD